MKPKFLNEPHSNKNSLVKSRLLLLENLLQPFEDGHGADVDAAVDQRRDVGRRFLDVVEHRVRPRVRHDAAVVQRLLPEQQRGFLANIAV